MGNKKWLSINLSEEENRKLEEAERYCALSGGLLLRVLVKIGFDEFKKEKSELVFNFDKDKAFERVAYKSKVIRLEPQLYDDLEQICKCTPFSMSSLAKYLAWPQIEQIIDKKGWTYKP